MNTPNTAQGASATGNGDARSHASNSEKNDKALNRLQAEQDMLYRLKSAIDSRGRYAYRLNDMAAGYAAGRGLSATAARMEIERSFTDQFGRSPQEYLDRHYEEMRSNGMGKLSNSKQPDQGQEKSARRGQGR